MPVSRVNRWQSGMITRCSGGKMPPAFSFANETPVALNPAASSMGQSGGCRMSGCSLTIGLCFGDFSIRPHRVTGRTHCVMK